MEARLREPQDPRVFGQGAIFDRYRPTHEAGFYERFMSGEKLNAPWVRESDFEPEPIKPEPIEPQPASPE